MFCNSCLRNSDRTKENYKNATNARVVRTGGLARYKCRPQEFHTQTTAESGVGWLNVQKLDSMAMLTLMPEAVFSFAALLGSKIDDERAKESNVYTAAKACREQLGGTIGKPWMSCVVQGLVGMQEKASWRERNHLMAIDSTQLDRLLPGGHEDHNTDFLKQTLRNYSCEVADGGSPILRSFQWTYHPPDPCDDALSLGADPSRFKYSPGFLPAGDELRSGSMTEQEAKDACDADQGCAGFTYEDALRRLHSLGASAIHTVHLKSHVEGNPIGGEASGWHTWRKLRRMDCSPAARQLRAAPMPLTVHVLRESPPVYVVDDFVSDDECSGMLLTTHYLLLTTYHLLLTTY